MAKVAHMRRHLAKHGESVMAKSRIGGFLVALVVASITVGFFWNRTLARSKPPAAPAKFRAQHLKPKVASMLSHQPFSFEENQGQTDPRVKFIARSPGGMVFISPTELTFRLDPAPNKARIGEHGGSCTDALSRRESAGRGRRAGAARPPKQLLCRQRPGEVAWGCKVLPEDPD